MPRIFWLKPPAVVFPPSLFSNTLSLLMDSNKPGWGGARAGAGPPTTREALASASTAIKSNSIATMWALRAARDSEAAPSPLAAAAPAGAAGLAPARDPSASVARPTSPSSPSAGLGAAPVSPAVRPSQAVAARAAAPPRSRPTADKKRPRGGCLDPLKGSVPEHFVLVYENGSLKVTHVQCLPCSHGKERSKLIAPRKE